MCSYAYLMSADIPQTFYVDKVKAHIMMLPSFRFQTLNNYKDSLINANFLIFIYNEFVQ